MLCARLFSSTTVSPHISRISFSFETTCPWLLTNMASVWTTRGPIGTISPFRQRVFPTGSSLKGPNSSIGLASEAYYRHECIREESPIFTDLADFFHCFLANKPVVVATTMDLLLLCIRIVLAIVLASAGAAKAFDQIGRASCRERG